MRAPHLSVLAACCAVGLTAISDPADAGFWDKIKNKFDKNDEDAPVQLPAEPGPPDHANSNSKGYPNGRPWQAVEHDFDKVHRKLYVIDDKVDEVLEDTDYILEDTDEILQGIDDIKEGIEGGDTDLDEIAADVAMLKNTLKVQIRVGEISEPDEVSIDSYGVTLYIQVTQNGVGVTELAANAFSYHNAAPAADSASYCGTDVCFKEPAGGNGLYVIEISAGEAGDYAATMAVIDQGEDVSIDSDNANGASIVTFEIEEPVVAPDP